MVLVTSVDQIVIWLVIIGISIAFQMYGHPMRAGWSWLTLDILLMCLFLDIGRPGLILFLFAFCPS